MILRPAIAANPCAFGRRGRPAPLRPDVAAPSPALGEELRLFAMAFAAGFVFVSVMIA